MNKNLYHGYSTQEIFKNEEDQNKILSMKEVEREKIIADRVMQLNHEKERKRLLNESENKNNEAKKIKKYVNESESEELGEIKEHKKRSRHKKSVDSKDEESSLSVEDEDEKQTKKEAVIITLDDMKKVVLTRSFFEKYYFYPNFDENVKGAFIRVNLASTGVSLQPEYSGYSIGEIEEIITKDKSYDFAGSKCNKYIKFKNLSEPGNFIIISNSDILEDEFNKLKSGEKPNTPTMEEIEKIQKNIESIRNKELTQDELREILTKKKKDRIKYKDSTLNVTEELDRTLEQYRAIKEEYDENKEEMSQEEIDNYIKQMKELEDDIKQLEIMKAERNRQAQFYSETDIVAKINEDIKEKRKMDERMSLLAKKRRNPAKEKENNLFRRVDCHPSNLFDSGKNIGDNLELKKRETSEFVENKNPKKKKNENNFSYAKKIRQFKDFISSKKDLIDEMMQNEKKRNNDAKEKKETDKNNKQSIGNIDMSLFFKLASINYDMYNKMIKDQNKQNTKDPEIKLIGFEEYLNEHAK